MILNNERQDFDKHDIHLSEQLSKLFPEVEDGGGKYMLAKTTTMTKK